MSSIIDAGEKHKLGGYPEAVSDEFLNQRFMNKSDAELGPISKTEQEYLKTYASGEYLAHHLAYQTHHKKEVDGKLVRDDTKPFTNGDIVSVLEPNGQYADYMLHMLHTTTEGLTGQILVPVNPKHTCDIKVTFRGTDGVSSGLRDIEYSGPGFDSYLLEKENILSQINLVVGQTAAKFNNKDLPINLTVAGHSLGASDAQHCAVSLMEAIAQVRNLEEKQAKPYAKHNVNHLSKVRALKVFTYNAPGVPLSLNKRSQDLAKKFMTLTTKNRFKINSYNLKVGGDMVQQLGQSHILSDVDPRAATVDVMKSQTGCEGTWLGTGTAHREHLFKELLKTADGKTDKKVHYERYNNKTPKGRTRVKQTLEQKTAIINNYAIWGLQAVVSPLTKIGGWCGNAIRKSLFGNTVNERQIAESPFKYAEKINLEESNEEAASRVIALDEVEQPILPILPLFEQYLATSPKLNIARDSAITPLDMASNEANYQYGTRTGMGA